MKMFYKIAAVALIMVGFSATANAQSTTNTSSATIVAPISITADGALEFGDIAARNGGVVIIAANGDRSLESGDAEILATNVGQAAGFVVEGEENAAFTVTLPSDDVLLTDDLTSETMIVNTFESSLTDNIGIILGQTSFTVGAVLTVGAEQPSGVYNGEFTVSVDYN